MASEFKVLRNKRILLVGAGPMAEAYVKVLDALNVQSVIICRSLESAQNFQNKTGHLPQTGGLENWLVGNVETDIDTAVVATPVENLFDNVCSLIKAGLKKILVEKPACMTFSQIKFMYELAVDYSTEVYVAYNRRFYSSVLQAENFIKNDGGVHSIMFEFTEWAHVIAPLKKGEGVKEKWFLANSTHVVDLVFFISGYPIEMFTYSTGQNNLKWHPSASRFAGSGITDKGIIFSYLSDWEAPGRWAVEILTNQHRLYLKPMEQLLIQKKGSVSVEPYTFFDESDQQFKPGLYRMTEAFLSGNVARLCTLKHQMKMMDVYYKMANYTEE